MESIRKSTRRTEAEIKVYLNQWKDSGKSQLTYSKEQGLNYYTFNKWVNDSKKSRTESKRKQGGFTALKVDRSVQGIFAQIKKAEVSVTLYQQVSSDYLLSFFK